MTRSRGSCHAASRDGVSSLELLSTTISSNVSAGASCRSTASLAAGNSPARLYVGRTTLTVGGISPPPLVRGVEVAADGLARLHVQQPRAVTPRGWDRRWSIAGRGADGVDPRLQAKTVADELEPPPSRHQHHRGVGRRGALLAVQGPAVAGGVEHLHE